MTAVSHTRPLSRGNESSASFNVAADADIIGHNKENYPNRRLVFVEFARDPFRSAFIIVVVIIIAVCKTNAAKEY